MGEIIKLRRKSTGQTRTMTKKGFESLSERDRKKWEILSGDVETQPKKKNVEGAAKSERTFDSTEVTVTGEPSAPTNNIFVDMSEPEPKTEEADEELTSLREQYRNLSQKEPKGNWKAKRLIEEIEKLKDGDQAE